MSADCHVSEVTCISIYCLIVHCTFLNAGDLTGVNLSKFLFSQKNMEQNDVNIDRHAMCDK